MYLSTFNKVWQETKLRQDSGLVNSSLNKGNFFIPEQVLEKDLEIYVFLLYFHVAPPQIAISSIRNWGSGFRIDSTVIGAAPQREVNY